MSEPVPLSTPEGTVMAWACGHCHRVAGGTSIMRIPYTAADVQDMAEFSARGARDCCACRECGGLWPAFSPETDSRPYKTCDLCWTPEREERAQAQRDERRAQARDDQQRVSDSVSKALDASAAWELHALMSELSEDCWCAGWLIDTERFLWSATAGCRMGKVAENVRWGMGTVSAGDVVRLSVLHDRAGGWWHSGPDHVCVFATTAEWAAIAREPSDGAAMSERLDVAKKRLSAAIRRLRSGLNAVEGEAEHGWYVGSLAQGVAHAATQVATRAAVVDELRFQRSQERGNGGEDE